jgi:hypothetical protein
MRTYSSAVVLAFALGLAGCFNISSFRTVSGSGHVVKETRNVANFDRVSVGGSGRLVVQQGDEESLTIETDDNLLPLIESTVSGRELRLGPQDVNIKPTGTIIYSLKVKNLNSVSLSGSLEAEAAQIKTDSFSVQVSGSGKVNIGRLEAAKLDIQVSGSGNIGLAGKVNQQRIGISGSGDYHAADLESAQADAQISGSGTLVVWARDSLNAGVSGSGDVSYYGNPKVDSQISGSGRVRRLGDK